MKKLMILKIFLWILLALWMGVIFFMSAQTAVQSSELSGNTIETLLKMFYPGFNSFSFVKQADLIEGFQFVARKGAHASIYAILGILSFCAVMLYKFKKRYKFLIALCISALYAVSDEIHQLFVAGRACELRDILIDITGALCGIFIVFVFYCLVLKLISKKMLKK